nr:glyoxylate/hydroxypyruvate reductase HPR3 [Tanacetum cinerariifolium]
MLCFGGMNAYLIDVVFCKHKYVLLKGGFAALEQSTGSDIMNNFPKLRFIITTSPGIDHIDLHECRRGIKVANAGTIFSEDVAHMDVGLLMDVLTRDSYIIYVYHSLLGCAFVYDSETFKNEGRLCNFVLR